MPNETSLTTLLTQGLLNNTGITVNTNLVSLVQQFNTQNISGAVQSALARVESDNVVYEQLLSTLRTAPSFITGIDPLIVSRINLPSSILAQAQSYFKTEDTGEQLKVAAFINVFNQVTGYITESFEKLGSLAEQKSKNFEDFGFQFSNYQDLITCGVSSQFNLAHLDKLANELPNLGDLFNPNDLSKIHDPGKLIQNILDRGLGYVGNLSTKVNGIDLTEVDDANDCLIEDVLLSITGTDLDEIFDVTGFRPANPDRIQSLNDVLKLDNVFSSDALKALDNEKTFNDLSRKLSNIGGKFTNFNEVGDFYRSIEFDEFPLLKQLPKPITDDITFDQLGEGVGVFNNPTIQDLLGTVSGYKYVGLLTKIIEYQQKIALDSDCQTFVNYLDNEPLDMTVLAGYIGVINNKSQLSTIIASADELVLECSRRLTLEIDNIVKSKAIVGSSLATETAIIGFSNRISTLALDKQSLGYDDFFKNISTADVYGEALKASLIEARNHSKMRSYGIQIPTKSDPLSYINSLPTS